jgi:tetratricopeptide (TPR) repeat protein
MVLQTINPRHNVSMLFEQAMALFRAGRPAESEKIARDILQLAPEHSQALHLLGVVLSQQGNHNEALHLIDAALNIDRHSAAFHNSRGNVLVALHRFGEALASFETAIVLDPQSAVAFGNRGNVCRELGRLDDAIASYDKAIALDPHDAEAFYNRGGALQELKRFEEAVATYDKAIALKPDYAEAFSNRGTVLQALGRFSEAVTSYNTAIALKANLPETLCSRGTAFQKMKRFDEAIASHDQAIALKPDFAEAFNYRGMVLEELGQFREALENMDKAIALKPDYAEAFSNRGSVLLTLGRLAEATDSFERAIELAPADANNYFNLITSRRVTAADPHFAAMKELARSAQSLEVDAQIRLQFALGKAFADIGDAKQSFHHLFEANSLKRQHVSYDEEKQLALFERIQTVFSAELMERNLGLGDRSAMPIFIVGMPRSGTTLVEQILASHPSVFGAGELQEFGDVALSIKRHRLEFPEAVTAISADELRTLGESYLQAVRRRAPGAERITDKMPLNFLYAGLISLTLPNARIIHTVRDPRDVALSCFSILFTKGQLEFTYDLAELGRYIRAYQGLMGHWRKVLPRGVMLELKYEEIVNGLEAQARCIVAHCGLPWNDACLTFHQTERIVRTASATQVRQPIYRNAIGRWRDYGDMLQPLLRELGV